MDSPAGLGETLMRITTYQGVPVFEVAWDVFTARYRETPQSRRVVIADGTNRPALYSPPEGFEDRGSYLTLLPAAWEQIKAKMAEALAGQPPPKRTRFCRMCRSEMRVAKEYGEVWSLACPKCGGVEVLSKERYGGTMGAGEAEKT